MGFATWFDWVLNGPSPEERQRLDAAKKIVEDFSSLRRGIESAQHSTNRISDEFGNLASQHFRRCALETPVAELDLKRGTKQRLIDTGYESLWQLNDVSARRLELIDGVGVQTSSAILQSVRSKKSQIKRSFSVPGPDVVDHSYKQLLSQAFLRVQSLEVPKSLVSDLKERELAASNLIARSEKASSLISRVVDGKRSALRVHEQDIHLVTLFSSDATKGKLRQAKEELAKLQPPKDFDTLVEDYRRRFADYSALFSEFIDRVRTDGEVPARTTSEPPIVEHSKKVDSLRSESGSIPSPRHSSRSDRSAPGSSHGARSRFGRRTASDSAGRNKLGSSDALADTVVAAIESTEIKLEGLTAILRGYQLFGAKFLVCQERAILGDEMGLGKTMQAMAAMVHLKNSEEGRRFLVVVPASTIGNWRNEVTTRTNLSLFVLHGKTSVNDFRRWVDRGGVGVTSFETLKNLMRSLEGVDVDFVVVDEAHFIKNPDAVRSRNVKLIAQKSPRVALMTGTPMENKVTEFGHLISVCDQSLAAQLNSTKHAQAFEAYPTTGFAERVAPVYLRRNQDDVLHELPELIEVDQWVELTDTEHKQYVDSLGDNIMRVRRAACGDLVAGTKIGKVKELLADYRDQGRKVICFSQYLDCLDGIDGCVDQPFRLDGSVGIAKRQATVEAFSNAPGFAVMSCQIDVAGVGLNLHAASVVILFEPQFKPTAEWQAIKRAHRMGQSRKVVVHRILAKDTIDERLKALLAEKTATFNEYVRESETKKRSGEATDSGQLDADSLLAAERNRRARVRADSPKRTTRPPASVQVDQPRQARTTTVTGWWLHGEVKLPTAITTPLGSRVRKLDVCVDIRVTETIDGFTIDSVKLAHPDENVMSTQTGEAWSQPNLPPCLLKQAVEKEVQLQSSNLNTVILRKLLS